MRSARARPACCRGRRARWAGPTPGSTTSSSSGHIIIARINGAIQSLTSYRQESLSLARFSLTDYYLSLDCDVLLTEPAAVELLVEKQRAVVAPMLGSAGLYSNYWGGMTETFYYQRTEQYRRVALII